ncbi:MAG: LysR substrate-binding domain-containing protein [Bacteroidota bacterium]
MELRHLLYFKVVAQELHFRNAASKLFISQPPLSRQIKELEQELGVVLFERNNKRVMLTEAGRYFQKEVELIFSRLEESKQIMKLMHGSISGELRIGYISSTYHIHLVNSLKEIRTVFPFVKTSLYEVPTVKQVIALEEGKLDIGILRAPIHSEKLKQLTLFTDPFVVVMPRLESDFTTLEDIGHYLKNQPFIFFNKDYAPDYHLRLVEICQRMGFSPDIVHEANNMHSIMRLVESGLGVSIVPSSLQEQYAYLNLSFFSLSRLPIATEVVLAYNPNQSNPAIDWFIEKYTAQFKETTN